MRKEAFSLMEMMIVLLIVAIVAAASAPMVSKKMLDSSIENTSPWQWAGLGGKNATFNPGGLDATASIGAANPVGSEKPKLFINIDTNEKNPHITFGEGRSSKLFFRNRNNSIIISNVDEEVPENAVAIGLGAQTSEKNSVVAIGNDAQSFAEGSLAIGKSSQAVGENSIALGNEANCKTNSKESIAIGRKAYASDNNAIAIGGYLENGNYHDTGAGGLNSIAIGSGSHAGSENSIAIGANARAIYKNSIALGADTKTVESNQIVIGGPNANVIIQGKLKVGALEIKDLNITNNLIVGNNLAVKKSVAMGDGVVMRHGRFFGAALFDDGDQNGIARRVKSDGNSRTDNNDSHAAYSLYNATFSDRRLKNVGEIFTDGLEKIRKIKVFNYTFKNDTDKTPRVGVIAQDLKKIFPNAVTKGDDGYLRIRMEDMFYAAINAIQQNDRRICELEKRIEELEKQLKK